MSPGVVSFSLLMSKKGFTKARRQQERFFVRGGYTPRGSSRTFAGGGSPKAAQQQLVGIAGWVYPPPAQLPSNIEYAIGWPWEVPQCGRSG